MRFPWRALGWFDWILLIVIEREEYFWLLNYSVLSARFPSSQCPNHHFKPLLEQRDAGTCCPPSAGTAAAASCFPQGRTCPWSRCPGKLSPFSSYHCCLLAACSCVHTPTGKHLPMGRCIHNSFPPPTEKLHYSKGGIETTTAFLEMILSPKSGNNLLGRNPGSSQSDPWFLAEVKSKEEMCHLPQVNSEYVLSLRVLQNFMEKVVIRTMVKISRYPEQVFTLENLIIFTTVKDRKLILLLFWLSQTPWFSYVKWVIFIINEIELKKNLYPLSSVTRFRLLWTDVNSQKCPSILTQIKRNSKTKDE